MKKLRATFTNACRVLWLPIAASGVGWLLAGDQVGGGTLIGIFILMLIYLEFQPSPKPAAAAPPPPDDKPNDGPEIYNFHAGVISEAKYQRELWSKQDLQKSNEEWFWTLGFLATKATQAFRYGDNKKGLHHIITAAALCENWHNQQLAELQAAGKINPPPAP